MKIFLKIQVSIDFSSTFLINSPASGGGRSAIGPMRNSYILILHMLGQNFAKIPVNFQKLSENCKIFIKNWYKL